MRILRRNPAAHALARDPHAHARMLAAASLDEALTSAESASLAAHLDSCRECRQAALDYAFQGERVHGLPAIETPRDLAASLAVRLDAEEAHRADERARRAGPRRISWQAHPSARHPSPILVPAGAGAPFRRPTPVAATVGAGAALSVVAAIALVVAGLPTALMRPAATPFSIEASNVSWVTRDADGRFLVQTASVDRACPGASSACQDFASMPTTLVALDMEPSSVLLARGGRDAIVIDAGAGGVTSDGGSIYAIELPTPLPTGAVSGTAAGSIVADRGSTDGSSASAAAASGAAVTAGTRTSIPGSLATVLSPAPVQSSQASSTAALVAGLATAAAASGRGTLVRRSPPAAPSAPAIVVGAVASLPSTLPLPTAAVTRAIAQDVVLVGGRAAYSPDGTWFAFSARPADPATGPDVYVWRVGEAATHAITTDHAAVFAGWVGERILVSAPDETARRTVSRIEARSADASPNTAAEPSIATSATPTPHGTARASAKPAPHATARPSATSAASAAAAATDGPSGSIGPAATSSPDAPAPTVPFSYLVDPATGARTLLDTRGLWMPSVDPTGSRVVGWLGTVRVDPSTRAWRPADGSLVVQSWPAVLGVPDAAAPSASPEPSATSRHTKAPRSAAATHAAKTPAIDATAAPRTSAPSPTPGATATAVIARASGSPTTESAPSPPPTSTSSAGPVGPVTLRIAGLTSVPATWQTGWDQDGTHLAVWVADAGSQEVGKLSLVALDAVNAASPKALLSATPALSAFSVGRGRIAWATPPDKAGAGGQVRMLVWSGSSVGEMFTGPITGLETLCGAD